MSTSGDELRDIFAGLAMNGILSAQTVPANESVVISREKISREKLAVGAYAIADAMLAERKKRLDKEE
jgi:hypothetical protein